jgi:hypothetical protein
MLASIDSPQGEKAARIAATSPAAQPTPTITVTAG